MRIENYTQHIVQIEDWLREFKLDTLVCGLGPTAWLLPWIDQSLLRGLRLWGCHDGCRIMPMDDLVIMDMPAMNLNTDSGRFQHTVNARPKRLWIYERNAPQWEKHLAASMKSVTQTVNWDVCRPDRVPRDLRKLPFKLAATPMHTTCISPTGMTTLAWREGARRIGVIGVDMMKNHHSTYQFWPIVDQFFVKVAQQAQEAGGLVANLSPVTSLKEFRATWKPPTSSSAPIAGSEKPEPSLSSNTASRSEPPATSASHGCEPRTDAGQPPKMVQTEAGSLVAQ